MKQIEGLLVLVYFPEPFSRKYLGPVTGFLNRIPRTPNEKHKYFWITTSSIDYRMKYLCETRIKKNRKDATTSGKYINYKRIIHRKTVLKNPFKRLEEVQINAKVSVLNLGAIMNPSQRRIYFIALAPGFKLCQ